MKKYYNIIMALVLSGFTLGQAQAQLEVCLDNSKIVGTDYYFDITLQSESAADIAHLYDSDFVLSFAEGDFSSPRLEKVANKSSMAGYCSFVSNDFKNPSEQATQLQVQKRYFDGTSTSVIGNSLVINLSAPTSGSSLAGMNEGLAKIDNQNSYMLGRFKVSGLATKMPSLDWVNDLGLRTNVFSIEAGTFKATPMNLTLCNNTRFVQDELVENNDILLFPNPLSSNATIEYQLESDSKVTISIVDVTGRLVAQPLVGESKAKGVYILNFDATKLAQGTYFYSMVIGGEKVVTKQMVVTR